MKRFIIDDTKGEMEVRTAMLEKMRKGLVVLGILYLAVFIAPSTSFGAAHQLDTFTDNATETGNIKDGDPPKLMVTITTTAVTGGVDVTKAIVSIVGTVRASDIINTSAFYGGVYEGHVENPTAYPIGIPLPGNTKGGSDWTFYILLKESAVGRTMAYEVQSIVGSDNGVLPDQTATFTVQASCNAQEPTDLYLVDKTDTTITIDWSTNFTANDYYKVYRQSESESQMSLIDGTVIEGEVPYYDSGLTQLTKYGYIVNGYDTTNVCESDESNTLITQTRSSDKFRITVCGGCHTTPPDDAPSNRGVPDGGTIGRHANPYHTGGISAGTEACPQCHASTVGYTYSHRDLEIAMNTTDIFGQPNSFYDKDRSGTFEIAIDNGFIQDNDPLTTDILTDNGVCSLTYCHGSRGGSPVWGSSSGKAQCVICHGMVSGVASEDTEGHTSPSDEQVGAHDNHLHIGSNFVNIATANPCAECHQVPTSHSDAGHYDDGDPAELSWGTIATNGGAITDGGYIPSTRTCTNVYCHDGRLFQMGWSNDAQVTDPVWDDPGFLNDGGNSVNCIDKCHGYPPPEPHDQDPDCSGCHTHLLENDYEFSSSKFYMHVDGASQALEGCVGCHAVGQGNRRAIVNTSPAGLQAEGDDFIRASRHVSNGSTNEIVTTWDCVLCHPEGKTDTGNTSSVHRDQKVGLRNVDEPGNPGVLNVNYWDWTNTTVATTADRDNMDTFCMTCHDSDTSSATSNRGGAWGVAVNSNIPADGMIVGSGVSRRFTPFNAQDTSQNVNDDTTHMSLRLNQNVIDVRGQFNYQNLTGKQWASHHNLNQFTKRYTTSDTTAWPVSTWTSYVTKENVTLNTSDGMTVAGLHCSDCHLNEVNAHGTKNTRYMLSDSAGGDIAPNDVDDPTNTLCFKCHEYDQYQMDGTGTNDRVQVHGTDGECNAGAIGRGATRFSIQCLTCHAGTVFGDIHGTGTGTDSMYDSGNAGVGGNSPRYRFVSGSTMRFYSPDAATDPTDSDWELTTGSAGCYTMGGSDDWATGSCVSHNTGFITTTIRRGRLLEY